MPPGNQHTIQPTERIERETRINNNTNSNCQQKSFDVTSQLNLNRYMNTFCTILCQLLWTMPLVLCCSQARHNGQKSAEFSVFFFFFLNVFITETKDEQERGGKEKCHFQNGPKQLKRKSELMLMKFTHNSRHVGTETKSTFDHFSLVKQTDLCF